MGFLCGHPRAKPTDGVVSRYLNRWLSAPLTALLLKTGVTPNQVTLAIGLLTIPLVAAGLWGRVMLVGLILQLASVLDGVDGELARAKGLQSRYGALLDTVMDYWLDSVGMLALGLALLEATPLPPPLILSLCALTIAVRLISQFVVKLAPSSRPHIIGDTRDVVTLLIFIGSLLAELLSPWCLVVVLSGINLWRLDNTAYRLFVAGRVSQGSEPKRVPMGLPDALKLEHLQPALAEQIATGSTEVEHTPIAGAETVRGEGGPPRGTAA